MGTGSTGSAGGRTGGVGDGITCGGVVPGVVTGRVVEGSFGAAGSVVVLLAWVYYSAQVFLVGAEFTWLYAHRFGSRAAPRPVVRDT